jgi:predicted transcriptional regulator
MEVLWSAGCPLTTRQLQDAIARAFPHRAGRKIQTVSTLLAELMAQGWVAGEKRGGTRWVYRPAVSRDEGLSQLARWVVEEFIREPGDRRHLVLAALRMVGFVPVGSLEGLVDDPGRQTKSAAAQPVSDAAVD